MNEEKKYSIVGQVTIGTDEYRDLIESVAEERARADRKNTEWYNEYERAKKLEQQVKELFAKCEKYEQFIKSESEREKYELWVIRTKGEFVE